MKAILLSLAIALLMVGCGEVVDYEKLQDRGGVKYLPNEEAPFTGRAERLYENGQKRIEGNYKDGKADGLETVWYENGQKMSESNFKDGKPNGIVTGWYINGQKKWEGNWKEGKTVSAKSWKPNGEKCPATNVKDGNGVGVQYTDDGTEESRYTFKDGEPFEEERSSKEELEELLVKPLPVASPI